MRATLAGAATAASLCFGSMAAQAQVTLGFNIEDPAGSYHAELTEKFADLVEEYSGGEVKVIVYPGGQQGNARESIEGMLIGTVDMTKSLFALAKETAQSEKEVFELSQRTKIASEVKSVLDSWTEEEQKMLTEAVVRKVQDALKDDKLQKQILDNAIAEVERESHRTDHSV